MAIRDKSRQIHGRNQSTDKPDSRKSSPIQSSSRTPFGLAIAEPLGHLSGRYPYAARLNEHHVRRFIASSRGRVCRKGKALFEEGATSDGAYVVLGLLNHNVAHDNAHVELKLSQETIAQMVGLSRETVSRLLTRLRRKRVLDWTRSDLIIRNRHALEKLADLPEFVSRACAIERTASHGTN